MDRLTALVAYGSCLPCYVDGVVLPLLLVEAPAVRIKDDGIQHKYVSPTGDLAAGPWRRARVGRKGMVLGTQKTQCCPSSVRIAGYVLRRWLSRLQMCRQTASTLGVCQTKAKGDKAAPGVPLGGNMCCAATPASTPAECRTPSGCDGRRFAEPGFPSLPVVKACAAAARWPR